MLNEFFRPDPKPTRARLKGKARTELRKAACRRALGLCETCGDPAPLYIDGCFNPLFCGHLSHKRHGSNKQDTLNDVIYECPKCHNKFHWKGKR